MNGIKGFLPESSLRPRFSIPTLPECHRCGLFRKCQSPKINWTGSGKRGILIFGEGPSAEDDQQNDVFQGEVGNYLNRQLATFGVNMRRDCWLDNSLACRPPGSFVSDPNWVEYCRPHVVKTIKDLNPTVIITLGGNATKSVLTYIKSSPADAEIIKWAGWRIPSQKINAWVCPIYHPTYLRKEREKRKGIFEDMFRKHLQAACSLTRRPWTVVPDYQKQVKCLYDSRDVLKAIEKIHTTGVRLIAIDYETNMLKPYAENSQIVSMSIALNADYVFSFPWTSSIIKPVQELLQAKHIGKIASNQSFEEEWTLEKLGHPVASWKHDTMLAGHIMDSRRGGTGIKHLSLVWLGTEDYDAHIHPYLEADGSYTENRIREIDMKDLLLYGGLDSLYEYKVAVIQRKRMGLIS